MLRPVLRFVVFHLIFFIPIPLPELKRGTKEAAKLGEELQRANASIATLDDDALEKLVSLLDEELRVVRSSISEARSRAAQLLGVTGVIAVLAGLGSTTQTSVQLVPTKGAAQVLTLVFAGMTGYALLGTLWLTVQTLAVRSWDELKATPVAQATSRRIREAHCIAGACGATQADHPPVASHRIPTRRVLVLLPHRGADRCHYRDTDRRYCHRVEVGPLTDLAPLWWSPL